MLNWQNHPKLRLYTKTICSVLIVTFSMSNIQYSHAQDFNVNQLPMPGTMVGESSPFAPLALKGLVINVNKPLEFQFIVDTGKGSQDTYSIKDQTSQLVKYFLAGITIPKDDLWVNLSPYEKNRIVPSSLGQTDLGRDLLAQDYILKQLTASLIYPEKDLGREFWAKVYSLAEQKFGTTSIPVNTFNKVWILPDQAEVFEKNGAAYITKSTLKVMLDEDYLAKEKHQGTQASNISSQIVREIVLPAIEKEVNQGKNFASLRQIYQALILAKWYKETIENGLMDALYTNKRMVKGVNVKDPTVKEEIYQRYLKAYKKGAFNYIKEDAMPDGQVVPRKYFSGGITQMGTFPLMKTHDEAMLSNIETDGSLLGVTVDCGIENKSPQTPQTDLLGLKLKETPAGVHHPQVKPTKVIEQTPSVVKKESVEVPVVREQQPIQPASTLVPSNSFLTGIKDQLTQAYDQAMIVFWAVVAAVGYFIYQVIINKIGKKKESRQENAIANPVPIAPTAPVQRNQIVTAAQRNVPQTREAQVTVQPQRGRNYQNPQANGRLPLELRQELERQIEQLGHAVAESSKVALIRSFRPTGPGELPLPIPITMLNQDANDRDKVIHILENMQRMMDGTDEKVLRDFERAIDNARDRVTEQALAQFDRISDADTLRLLTSGYIDELQREFHRIFEEQVEHMQRFYAPSYHEQNLYVSEEINERYPRLPRYLKWILTNNPDLENDFYVREWLNMIQNRVNQIPAFPDMITGYSKVALTKSLYLNPELARKVLLFLTRNTSQGFRGTSDADVRTGIQLELARTITEDNFIEGEVVPDEAPNFPAALEAPPQQLALPKPDATVEDKKAQLRALTDNYTQFLTKYREQQEAINKVEADIKELSEGLAEAKRTNDRIVIDALQPAVEGLTNKLRKLNEKMPRLNQDKARLEQQISALRTEIGPSGTNLYSFDPVSAGVIAVFTVMFGIPLWITKAILKKWYNTTAGKTLGMGASIAALVVGYYAYLGSLSPQIQQMITDPSNTNPWLATFFAIWPVAILSGVWGGHVGKGFSHSRLYSKAKSAFKKGNNQEALAFIEGAIKLKPKEANDYYLKGEILRKLQRLQDAISAYKKALEFDPNDSTTQNNLGVAYDESGNPKLAIESYKRAIELEPNDPVILSNLGKSLHTDGQLLDAARYLQRSQQIKPNPEVTQELTQILRQTGNLPKPKAMSELPYLKTMSEVVPSKSEWVNKAYSDIEEWGGGAFFGGLVAAGAFIYGAFNYHWWQMGTDHVSTVTQWSVWLGAGITAQIIAFAGLFVVGKVTDVIITIKRFFGFNSDYKKIQKVNRKTSDEISDAELQEVAPMYARMSKPFLEAIFRSWVDADQEEKVARLLKFGKWDYDKKALFGDIGEYKRVSKVAAARFGTSVTDQKVILDQINTEKDRLSQKGINNPVGLMKDILPQITDNSRTKDEFLFWLGQMVNLPVNILNQGQRYILPVFNDLREYEQAKADALRKFGPASNQTVNSKINELARKLEQDGLNNYPSILKRIIPEINSVARNTDEFIFWINEVLRFEKQWFSSGNFLSLLQNLIAFQKAKEDAIRKLATTDLQKTQLNQAVDGLRADVHTKQPQNEVAILKDILPRVTEVSGTLAEYLEYIAVLKSFDRNMWGSTHTVLTAFNNHAGYKQAREKASAKFASDTVSRQKFLSDIDALRAKLVAKGFPQASDMLKDVLPELTKTCRTKEEFLYWLGEMVGLNTSEWQRGPKAVIDNFNSLNGFKMVKESAVAKLASTAQEKADLTRTIDKLRSELESRVPSCAGFLKDVILEILKDIDVLAQPPHKKSEFVWFLTKVVNFETPTWIGGSTQAIVGYQELKRYVLHKRAYLSKYGTTPDNQQRIEVAFAILDKNPNFTRPTFVSILNNALEKVSEIANNPREFIYWVGTFSELNPNILEIFCRDIDVVLSYYQKKGKNRDFNHLPDALNQYNKKYNQTVLITPNLLDILTDSNVEIAKRVKNAVNYIIEQQVVKLGAPPNILAVHDIVSYDQLLTYPDIGEDVFKNMISYSWQSDDEDESYSSSSVSHVRQIASKMGTEGLYTYWQTQKPAYYQEFLKEAEGLAPDFNKPGEKFRISYDGTAIGLSSEELKEVAPMSDNLTELKILIQVLRSNWPNFYENYIQYIKDKLEGKPAENVVSDQNFDDMAVRFLKLVQSWEIPNDQKAIFIFKLLEILSFPTTTEIRARIASTSDEFIRMQVIAEYWEKVYKFVKTQKYAGNNTKFYPPVVKSIQAKIALINNKMVQVGEGVFQFYLSGHTLSDFFRGHISRDCTAYMGVRYKRSIGQISDPSFFLFKVMEKGIWWGNIYSLVVKTSDGKYGLFLDWFKINPGRSDKPVIKGHPLIVTSAWESRRKKFVKDFYNQFKAYLASEGFDYLIIAPSNSESNYPLYNLVNEEAKAESNSGPISIQLKRLGDLRHLQEGSLPEEYVQNFGDLTSMHSVSGYKIALDKTNVQVLKQRQLYLEHIENLLSQMATEETRLARLAKEQRQELNRINELGIQEANSGRNAIAIAYKERSETLTNEVQKNEYELNDLHIKLRQKQEEYDQLANNLGVTAPKRHSFTNRVASLLIPFAITSTLFLTQKAQAQDYYGSGYYNSSWDFTPLYWIAGVGGFLGLVYYLLNKAFPSSSQYDRGSYYERTYYPTYKQEDLSLPDDLKTMQAQVLENVTGDNRGLLPQRLDVKIPFQIGISREQGIKALTVLYSTILREKSIFEFFKKQEFYAKFKQHTKGLGLADDFDQPQRKSYNFTIGKEEIRYEEDRRAEEFIGQYLKKLVEPKDMDQPAVQAAMQKQRGRILSTEWFKGDPKTELFAYYQLMLANTAFGSKEKVEAINRLIKEKNALGALSVLEEIYRIDVGGEQIALETNATLRGSLNKILQRELEDIHRQIDRSSDFQANKKEIIKGAKDIQFELRLSERNADDVLRGVASGDCTSIIGGSAYYNTIPQFMFDPGLQVFRVLQEGKWVGNVYTIVAEKNGKPVLIVDAVQLPVWGRTWPVSVKELADKVLEKVVEYAHEEGFDEVLMSSFVSNFNAIHDHFAVKYDTTLQEIEKVGGFDHLVSLGLWDSHATRNEYLETYSPHWNSATKKRIDPNNPRQTLMLRTIWQSPSDQLDNELASGNSIIPDMAMTTQVKKPVSSFRRTLQKIALGVAVALPLMLATTGKAQAEVITSNSNGTLHVSVEQNDTFGQILLDAGYRGDLWGTKGIVSQLQSSVEKQIPSHNIGIIGPGIEFNLPNPIVFDPEVRGYMQQLSHAINHLNTASRIFSTDQLKGLDQLLNNVPQKVLDNEQANNVVKEVKQARADMDSNLFRINMKGANVDSHGFHTGDGQRFSFTPDGQTQLKIVGDIHRHYKAAETQMKPFITKKGFSLNLQGNIHLGPLTVHLPGIALGKSNPPVGVSGDISAGNGTQEVSPDAQKTIDQLNNQLKAVQSELDNLRQSHSNLNIENNDLKSKLAQAQQQIDQLKAGNSSPDDVTQLQNKKSDLERQLTDLKMQQDQAKADLQRTQAEKEKVSTEVNTLNQQIPALENQADTLKGQVSDLGTQKEQTKTQVTQLQTQKDTLQGNVTQLTHDRDGLQQQLDQLKGQIEQAKIQLGHANSNSTPTFNNIWANLSSWEKIGIFLLSLTGIGIIIAAFMMWKKIKRYENLNGNIQHLLAQADGLEGQIAEFQREKDALVQEIETKKNQSAELDRQKQEKDAEIQRVIEGIETLKTQQGEIQNQVTAAKEEKDRIIAELEGNIADLKRQVEAKEAEIVTLTVKQQELAVVPPPLPQPVVENPINDDEVAKAVELLRSLKSKVMQQRLKSEKNHVKESIQFIHDELGLDIENGQGRSLLLRSIDALKAQKEYLKSLGLPLTVTNLASSKRGFARKELKQIMKLPEWPEMTSEEKLAVVSHLYDIYGLRSLWQTRHNDWLSLLRSFQLPIEPINYTPRSIDFIQRYELARFNKFRNINQTKARLSKMREIVSELKVGSLLNTITTPEGFELYVVKPEVWNGQVEFDRQNYPLPKVNFDPLTEAGEEPADIEAVEPPPQPAPQQEEITALQEEMSSLQSTIEALNQEKIQKTTELEQAITELNGQKDALATQIADLQGALESQKKTVSEQEQRATSLKEEIAVHEQTLARIKETVQNETAGLTGQQQEILNKRQEISTLNQEAQGLRQDIGGLEGQKTELSDSVSQKQQELEGLEQRLREVQNALSEQTQTNEQVLSQQQIDIQAKEAQKQSLQEKIDGLNRQKQEALEAREHLEGEKTNIRGEVDTLTTQRDIQSSEVESLGAKIASLREEETSVQRNVDGLRQSEQSLREEISKLEQRKKELTEGEQLEEKEVEAVTPQVEGLVKEAGDLVRETLPKEISERIPVDDLNAIQERYAQTKDTLVDELNHGLGEHSETFQSKLGQKIQKIYAEYPSVYDWFLTQDFYKEFKKEAVGTGLNPNFDHPGKVVDFNVGKESFSLELSDRGPEYLIRGLFSGDCTNPYKPFSESSFQSATLRHLVMPSFLNFKVLRGKEWVGNIYAVVIQENGKPVLVIDAMQIPWRHPDKQPDGGYLPQHFTQMLFPVLSLKDSEEISNGAIEGLTKYAEQMGYNELWHSSFVSNFFDLKRYYTQKYQGQATSEFNSLDMMIGYAPMQEELKLGRIYLESYGNPSAWKIWQRGVVPTVTTPLPLPTVEQKPEAFIEAIRNGQYISPEIVQMLSERFHIGTAWLADRLKQRMSESRDVRKVFGILSTGTSVSQWMRQNKKLSGYKEFEEQIQHLGIKPEFDMPGLQIQVGQDQEQNDYKLVLSSRDADDIVRGYISGDCTNPGWAHANETFNNYFPAHILQPGFLNFKIYRKPLHGPYEWVGNVYAAVGHRKVKGLLYKKEQAFLLIDAIQIPWVGVHERDGMQILPLPSSSEIPFPVKNLQEAEKISNLIVETLATQYARNYNFGGTYLGFGSNFIPLVEHFYRDYYKAYNRLIPPSQVITMGGMKIGPPVRLNVDGMNVLSEKKYEEELKGMGFELIGLDKNKLDSFNNRRGFADIGSFLSEKRISAGSAKGKGMFSAVEHQNVNQVIATAQRDRRGELIWGNAPGWNDNRAKYTKNITWDIESLRKKYPSVKVPGLGKVEIADVLASSSIVLIVPPANGPPGLINNSINSYQIAHNGLRQNTIYLDQYTFNQLHEFEVAILLAHEAIQLGAKKIAAKKGISWTEQLARQVTGIADEWEIAIVGRGDKGRGSRFDERIENILEFNKPKPEVREPHIFEIKPEPRRSVAPPSRPKPFAEPLQPQPMPKPQETNGKFNLDFPDTNNSVVEGLNKLFWDSMFKETDNLPVKWEAFPPPMAREIKNAHDLGKIDRMPLDPTLLTALTMFFSRLFPNHANSLIEYLRTLHIFIIDNERSTFGATLDGDTFYIQRSLFDDLLKKHLSVDEINRRIKNKDKELLVALFRIIIHEIGAAFFKTSHEANQDMEQIFLGLLNRTTSPIPYRTQEEFRRINTTVDLNSLPRQDWAINDSFNKEEFIEQQIEIASKGYYRLFTSWPGPEVDRLQAVHSLISLGVDKMHILTALRGGSGTVGVEKMMDDIIAMYKNDQKRALELAERHLFLSNDFYYAYQYNIIAASILVIGGSGYDDVIENLIQMQPHGTYSSLMKFAKQAIEYKKKGYRFRVILEPRIERNESNEPGVYIGKILKESEVRIVRGNRVPDYAMLLNPKNPGGIDFNQINIKRSGNIIRVNFDPAELSAIEKNGFEGFTPIIVDVFRIQSPLPLLGVNDPKLFAQAHKGTVTL